MLDIDDAIAADTILTPSKIAIGEGTGGTTTLSITNNSATARTYSLAHDRAVSTFGSTFLPSATPSGATVAFSRAGVAITSVAVAAGATETVNVTFTTPGLVNGLVYGGYLRVTAVGQTYRVPYAGFWGDYQLIQVLAPGGCSFPGIFKLGGQTQCGSTPAVVLPSFTKQNDAAIFNVEDRNDRPVLLYHRAHQSERLEIRAIDQATNLSYLVASADYLSRNATNGVSLAQGGFSGFVWDGKRLFTNGAGLVRSQALPAGLYRLQLVVTKALAEAENPAHIETWTSPVISIVRY
jgi:hypothetical protein